MDERHGPRFDVRSILGSLGIVSVSVPFSPPENFKNSNHSSSGSSSGSSSSGSSSSNSNSSSSSGSSSSTILMSGVICDTPI